ncbi:acetyl-CoA carboxylase carboxyltransferase subunit alpha [Hippea maritima]|uniref:Acetyl-coenzyme A carboxylase carboxyl transferase subunit alpha n=1 Tax=Hippea maritima (strain ATCC 700847 / DSM 10411 / MH2) TaxID=760142 RepID=F2LWN6_HIPMA|nr:acetyl-CoA carboxylase carboxyltransferase subunit alpha [Hippea maritima]AEA33014.1 Acetyl-coenzyme A carboxylase carboxyl transferase subunit alpha [Hippea maritima DSM 10411]
MLLLDFEKPIYEIEEQIENLKKMALERGLDVKSEIEQLEKKKNEILKKEFENLSIDKIIKIARHPNRPYTLDYIERIVDDFTEVHGDRHFADDKAIVTGFGYIDNKKVAIIGHQKGKNTKDNLYRNFGMANPEGYRKSQRIMQLAEKFNIPIVTFVDTPGAYPGIGAEERGQSEAIAVNLFKMFKAATPIVCIITGEGGSGGALAIAVGDKVGMLEFSIYGVISPEGCSSILWRDASHSIEAAKAMKVTAKDLYELGVIDEIIKEPIGGAHRDYDEISKNVKNFIVKSLDELQKLPKKKLLSKRWEKWRKMTTQFL